MKTKPHQLCIDLLEREFKERRDMLAYHNLSPSRTNDFTKEIRELLVGISILKGESQVERLN